MAEFSIRFMRDKGRQDEARVYVTNTLGEIIIRTDGYKMSVHQYLQ